MATGVMPPIGRRNEPSQGRRWLSAGTGFCALVTAPTIAPLPSASANMLHRIWRLLVVKIDAGWVVPPS